jgi:hypothetical protein
MVQIKMRRTTLYLTEQEIYNNLPADLVKEAIRRGKAFTRHEQTTQRIIKKRQEGREPNG